jgi:PKD repeat protein
VHELLQEIEKVNDAPVTDTEYVDVCVPGSGNYTYFVRAINLQQTPSGSYFDLNQADFAEVHHELYPWLFATFSIDLLGNNAYFTNESTGDAVEFYWDFGDGTYSTEENPLHIYAPGLYIAELKVRNPCDADSVQHFVEIPVSTDDGQAATQYRIQPNPSDGNFSLDVGPALPSKTRIILYTVTGKIVFEKPVFEPNALISTSLPDGVYIVRIESGDFTSSQKLIINHAR